MQILPAVLKSKLANMKGQKEVTAEYAGDVKKFNDLMEILNGSDFINNQILSVPSEDWYWLREKLQDFEDMDSEFCQEVERNEWEREVYNKLFALLFRLPVGGKVSSYV